MKRSDLTALASEAGAIFSLASISDFLQIVGAAVAIVAGIYTIVEKHRHLKEKT